MSHNANVGVVWAIDGRVVPLDWDSVTMSVPGGMGGMGLVPVPSASFPRSATVFSSVTATRTDGVPFYVGELVGPPYEHHGQTYLQIGGLAGKLARQRGRRLYQSKDLTKWVSADAEPHNYTSLVTSGGIGNAAHGTIESHGHGTAGSAGFVFWARGELVTRLAFTTGGGTGTVYSAVGPNGTLTSEGTYSGSGAKTFVLDSTLNADLVALTMSATVDVRIKHTEVRVNGRAAGDTMSPVELADDIAALFGWGNVSPASGVNLLPLDWEGDWPSGMSEAAGRFDGMWLLLPSRDASADLYIGPWGRRTWTVRGADYGDLLPQVRYNKVTVGYNTPAGVLLESVAEATNDPYGGSGLEVVWPPGGPYTLNDAQTTSANADAAAAILAEYWSQPRVSGQIPIGRIWGDQGEAHPWDIDAGDLLELPELAMLGVDLPPQRVVEVVKNADGSSVVSVSEATSLDGLLGSLDDPVYGGLEFEIDVEEKEKKKRRKKKKKKKKWHPKYLGPPITKGGGKGGGKGHGGGGGKRHRAKPRR